MKCRTRVPRAHSYKNAAIPRSLVIVSTLLPSTNPKGGANNLMATVMHSIERMVCVPHSPARSLNMKSEIFSDFVSVESSNGSNPPPASTLSPSSPSSAPCSSAGDRLEFNSSNAEMKNDEVFTRVLLCNCFYL